MNPPVPQVVERMAWEGIVSGPTALALGVLLAILTAWFLWRERQAVGPRWAAVFWVLRVVAFGCVLWMLAGPTQLRIQRTVTPQSVAIFADDSQSMDVIDVASEGDSVRWQLAVDGDIDGGGATSPVVHCDRLIVDLGAATTECQRLALLVKEHRPVKQLTASSASLAKLVGRAREHAAAIAESVGGDDATLAERADRIEAVLAGPAADSLAAVDVALSETDRTQGNDLTVRFEQFAEALAGARRRATVLAIDLAQQSADQSTPERADTDRLSRREKVGRVLDALQDSLESKLADGVRIRRFRFDSSAAAIDSDEKWAQALDGSVTTQPALPITDADDRVAAEQDAAAGGTTNLSAVLAQLAVAQSHDATRMALVLTDGRHNSPGTPPPQEVAAQLANLSVYLVPIGNAQQLRDVLLHRVEAPAVVTEKDSALIDVIVSGFDCEGESSAVVLRQEGREIDRQPIQFTGDRGDQRARFKVPAKTAGWQEYVVEVEPVSDEANTANNFMPVSFEVVHDRTRVLLADGVARWEYRYLNQLFRREEHVEFDELLFFPRVHGSGQLADRPEFPTDLAGWSRYDVVILGDVSPQQLSPASQRSLAEYVRRRGGNLIVIAGGNSMPADFAGGPLMDLLPVERDPNVYPRQSYSVRVSDEGRFHSAMLIADSAEESIRQWQSIYERFPVFGLSDYSKPKSTARTLLAAVPDGAGEISAERGATDGGHALLCWQRVGAGRVAYLGAPETYRLRWRRGDELHHRFWGQFLRWITAANSGAGADLVRLQTDHTNYLPDDTIEVTAWLKDTSGRPLSGESIEAEARTFGDQAVSVALESDPEVPGRYFGSLDRLPVGAYQMAVKGPIVDKLLPPGGDNAQAVSTITVRSTGGVELANTQCNRPLMEQVAEITGGQLIPPTAIDEIFQLVSFSPEVDERIERTPLWDRWTSLLLVLGCVFTEWIVRKSKGLV
jgi:hypothetical protein